MGLFDPMPQEPDPDDGAEPACDHCGEWCALDPCDYQRTALQWEAENATESR